MKKVEFDPQTKALVGGIIQTQQKLASDIRLILQTYLNAKELPGRWTLAPDASGLILVEEEQANVPKEDA